MTQPTRAELVARVSDDYRTELGATLISRSWETAAAVAQADLAKGLYGYQDWALRQLSPDLADDIYFWRWAALLEIQAKPPAPWKGILNVTGVTGVAIPEGATLSRTDGQIYSVLTATTVGGTVTVVALTPGSLGNCKPGQPLTFSTPIAGVGPTPAVAVETQTGTDAETRDQALPRVLARLSDPPRGGSLADYKRWALEVPGVTRAGAKVVGVNKVAVWALRDTDGAPTGDTIPSAEECVAIEDHISLVRPAQVFVDVVQLTALPMLIIIDNLTPDTPTNRASVKAAIWDFFRREAQPDGTIYRSRLDDAISSAEGEFSHTLSQFSVQGQAPTATGNITASFTQLPTPYIVLFV